MHCGIITAICSLGVSMASAACYITDGRVHQPMSMSMQNNFVACSCRSYSGPAWDCDVV